MLENKLISQGCEASPRRCWTVVKSGPVTNSMVCSYSPEVERGSGRGKQSGRDILSDGWIPYWWTQVYGVAHGWQHNSKAEIQLKENQDLQHIPPKPLPKTRDPWRFQEAWGKKRSPVWLIQPQVIEHGCLSECLWRSRNTPSRVASRATLGWLTTSFEWQPVLNGSSWSQERLPYPGRLSVGSSQVALW